MSDRIHKEFEKWVHNNVGTIFSPRNLVASRFYFFLWESAYRAGMKRAADIAVEHGVHGALSCKTVDEVIREEIGDE